MMSHNIIIFRMMLLLSADDDDVSPLFFDDADVTLKVDVTFGRRTTDGRISRSTVVRSMVRYPKDLLLLLLLLSPPIIIF